MRKLFIALFFVLLLVVGCDPVKLYTVVISNESLKTVSYVYNDSSDTLVPSTSKTYYEVKAHTQPPKDFVDQDGKETIKIKYNGITGDYTFIDKDP